MKKVIIIGAGLGGLCTAILLAHAGYHVEVFEKNDSPGGKLFTLEQAGYRFTYGPSTLTMPEIYQELLCAVEESPIALPYRQLHLNHRDVFADGMTLEAKPDIAWMQDQLIAFHASDATNFAAYLSHVQRIERKARTEFFSRDFTKLNDFIDPNVLMAMAQVSPFTSMHDFHARYFQDPRIQMTLDRFATYVGSDPRKTPATLAMIGALEYGQGVFRLEGGSQILVDTLMRIAKKKGVAFHFGARVDQLLQQNKKIIGIEIADTKYPADAVIFNGDRTLWRNLLVPKNQRTTPKPMLSSIPRSFSGFVLLLGVRKHYAILDHHTVFFPSDYTGEFTSIFQENALPKDPTIYISYSGFHEKTDAPDGGSNLFVLVNVPAKKRPKEEWQAYEDHILDLLMQRCGLTDLRQHLEVVVRFTPDDLEQRTGAFEGSIYGRVSHGYHAFLRPGLQTSQFRNLFFVGGSNHPGGGTPMVALGARLVANLVQKRLD